MQNHMPEKGKHELFDLLQHIIILNPQLVGYNGSYYTTITDVEEHIRNIEFPLPREA